MSLTVKPSAPGNSPPDENVIPPLSILMSAYKLASTISGIPSAPARPGCIDKSAGIATRPSFIRIPIIGFDGVPVLLLINCTTPGSPPCFSFK